MVEERKLAPMPVRPEEQKTESKADFDAKKVEQKKLEAQRRQARTFAKQQQIAERIAAATEELSSGVEEASGAVEELRSAMEQIASGAEEASSATQESLAAINQIEKSARKAAENAAAALDRGKAIQLLVKEVSSDIEKLAEGVNLAAAKNEESARLVAELEKLAENIGSIVRTVVKIADQTNLLALNAAIEAARAGDHGKGFAVVADEVRTLAETSEKAANDIRELIAAIQQDVKVVADAINQAAASARQEAEKGRAITDDLANIRAAMEEVVTAAGQINNLSQESMRSIQLFQQGANEIARTAEEQSSGAEEALKAVDQQAKALSDISTSASELAEMAEDLKRSTDVSKSAEGLAAAAEELSAAIEESTRSAQEIMAALDQISKGAQAQARAAEESAGAAAQIESGVRFISEQAGASLQKVEALSEILARNKVNVDELIRGISLALEANIENVKKVKALEERARQIDKIVDTIVTVGIQTNMLAVSGAIEAARAGEYGKGFAVVASDIRNLAQESARNADQIKDQVKGIQGQVNVVLKDIEEIGEVTRQEVEKAKKTTEDLVRIEEDMKAVLGGTREINENAAQIAAAVEQARKAVDQIAQAAQEAASASEQAATASRQQAQGMQELSRAIEEIAALADELQQL
ncbi:methyl-accepting chemotaxis protein [Desulfofundulus sp. TPOSR]|uniref:methyl-accepting chemotaxis protein n=1 Tax=Desulfofundulus sp. TPOSR TaxID=2714340 RepID=UPI00140CBA0C|nr:methyl-accepting chemotaxis protein [Desulfofundulus sp. TPOSR]NHM25898.1 methyl-accepting chemotaxis protein [Desulfofundulus sp. TPOSR]